MTIQYKNAQIKLSTTNMTTVLTINTSSIAIVKSMYVSNNSTGAVTVNCDLRDSSASADTEFFRQDIPANSTVNATAQGLNLEAGDAITVQAATGSNTIQGLISFALIDRSQENG